MEEENQHGMLTNGQRQEIANKIAEGFTSGRLDEEDGTKVAWEIKTEIWKD